MRLIFKHTYKIIFLTLLFLYSNVSNSQDSLITYKIDSLKNILNKNPKKDSLLRIYEKICIQYYFLDDFTKSIEYGNKILENIDTLEQETKKNKYLSRANELIGINYYSMDLYSKALEYSSKALLLAKEIKDTTLLINISLDIGNIYEGLGDNDLAYKYYSDVAKYSEQTNDMSDLALAYNNLGIIFSNKGDEKKAMVYYKKSSKLKKEVNGISDATSYINIGDSYRKNNELDSAKKYLTIALNIQKNDNEAYITSVIYHDFALLYLAENNLNKAEEFILKSKDIAINKNLNALIIDAYELLSKIYKKKKDYNKALYYHEKYATTNDSLLKINQQSHISHVELLHDAEKQRLKIEKLNVEDNLKTLRITSFQHRQNLLIIGLILFFIIAIIFIIQNYKIKSAYRKIVDENVKTTDYKTEIKRLRKELTNTSTHNNVENNISVKKYSDSPLTEEQKQIISEKIYKALDDEKVYLDIDLKLTDFAEQIGINKTYISQVLNEVMSIGFSEIINQCRIDEAKRLLIDEKNNNLTIEAIAQKAGFKSSSTFNRVFKNETGITPSFFLKNIRKKI